MRKIQQARLLLERAGSAKSPSWERWAAVDDGCGSVVECYDPTLIKYEINQWYITH